ncbi:MAG: hydrogenase expression/formation protein HypE [Chloroflexi bacterium]|nr:hydrogenase expression/formation protein HypE [Chloroflexota bacterium]
MTDAPLPTLEGAVCPVPLAHNEQIVMGHGSGGKMSHDLIARHFMPAFANASLAAGNDGSLVQTGADLRLAISTDSHVVWPLFFPGGDIGRLAVCGTVNDVAMMGAELRCLTAGFILEEGLPLSTLQRVIASMQAAAEEAGVPIVAGDTKVVQKGKADGLYINTTGVGVIPSGIAIGGELAQPGDIILLSGAIGDHGIAVLSARGELAFEASVVSDVAPLNRMVAAMLQASPHIHTLRDPTRGGLATTLNEIARQSRVCLQVDETRVPVNPEVAAACEMLGFDPFYVANEGKLIAILPAAEADAVLSAMRSSPYGAQAAVIGQVLPSPHGRVLMKTTIGATRILDMLSGELLPRIC